MKKVYLEPETEVIIRFGNAFRGWKCYKQKDYTGVYAVDTKTIAPIRKQKNYQREYVQFFRFERKNGTHFFNYLFEHEYEKAIHTTIEDWI